MLNSEIAWTDQHISREKFFKPIFVNFEMSKYKKLKLEIICSFRPYIGELSRLAKS